jgi:S-adenosylmethionine:tRNA ribosyltransferase-isomerase
MTARHSALTPATGPGHHRRLLTFPAGELHPFEALPRLLAPGDLIVVNDAATLPASLAGHTQGGAPIEIRLSGRSGDTWETIAFGPGDWRTDTDLRPAPPDLHVGDVLHFHRVPKPPYPDREQNVPDPPYPDREQNVPDPPYPDREQNVPDPPYPDREHADLAARIVALPHPRRPVLKFLVDEGDFWRLLYAVGRPVQYQHLATDLDIWDAQTRYAGPPWAVEPPSAGMGLTTGTMAELRAHGIAVASITEAAGLSATGDAALDASLPFPERYAVPPATWHQVQARIGTRQRVVAVGTSVVRALETVGRTGVLTGVTSLRLSASNPTQVVDGLLSGVHADGTSHRDLIDAVLLGNGLPAWPEMRRRAATLGLRDHEFGDGVLLLQR